MMLTISECPSIVLWVTAMERRKASVRKNSDQSNLRYQALTPMQKHLLLFRRFLAKARIANLNLFHQLFASSALEQDNRRHFSELQGLGRV